MPFGSIPLNDGNQIPAIAFGTGSTLFGKEVTEYVKQALENGFNHIDTSAIYANESNVGDAIRDIGLDRKDLYITTKYDGGSIPGEFEISRKKIGVERIDLYLIHLPRLVAGKLEASWREFEKLKEDGLVKSIGVSNLNLSQLDDLLKIARIKPAVNQIRLHPYNWAENKELIEYSNKHGIVTEAFSSLTPITKAPGGPVDPVLEGISLRLNATPAQVIFAWLKAKNIVLVTTTTKKPRLQEYLAVADLPRLTEEDISAIEEAGAKGPPKSPTKI